MNKKSVFNSNLLKGRPIKYPQAAKSQNVSLPAETIEKMRNVNDFFEDKKREEDKRNALSDHANNAQIESLEILKDIEANTAYLKDMVEVMNSSNEKQDEMLAIYKEILSIITAKDKKEADSIYRRLMNKINEVTNDADNVAKLTTFAVTIFNLASTFL